MTWQEVVVLADGRATDRVGDSPDGHPRRGPAGPDLVRARLPGSVDVRLAGVPRHRRRPAASRARGHAAVRPDEGLWPVDRGRRSAPARAGHHAARATRSCSRPGRSRPSTWSRACSSIRATSCSSNCRRSPARSPRSGVRGRAWSASGRRPTASISRTSTRCSPPNAPRVRRVKFLYVIPNFQNPTGGILSLAKRRALLEWSAREQVLIVEDDPYGDLWFPDVTRPGRDAPDQGRRRPTGVSSTCRAPRRRWRRRSARHGWSRPTAVIARLDVAKQSADLCSSALDQRIVHEAIVRGVLDRQLPLLRETYARKRDVMSRALSAQCADLARWTPPRGGFFLWVVLPEGIDTRALLPRGDRGAGDLRRRARRSSSTARARTRCGWPSRRRRPRASRKGSRRLARRRQGRGGGVSATRSPGRSVSGRAGRPNTCSSATRRPSAIAATRKSPGSVARAMTTGVPSEHFQPVLGQRVLADLLAGVHRIAAQIDGDPRRDQRVADAERSDAWPPGQRLSPPLRAVAAIEGADHRVHRREVHAFVVGNRRRRPGRSRLAIASARAPACRPGNRSSCRSSRRRRVRRAERWSRCCRRAPGSRSPCRVATLEGAHRPVRAGQVQPIAVDGRRRHHGRGQLLPPDLGAVGTPQREHLAGLERGDDPARACDERGRHGRRSVATRQTARPLTRRRAREGRQRRPRRHGRRRRPDGRSCSRRLPGDGAVVHVDRDEAAGGQRHEDPAVVRGDACRRRRLQVGGPAQAQGEQRQGREDGRLATCWPSPAAGGAGAVGPGRSSEARERECDAKDERGPEYAVNARKTARCCGPSARHCAIIAASRRWVSTDQHLAFPDSSLRHSECPIRPS